jgi:hypothetical protein
MLDSIKQVRAAFSLLNPSAIRERAERPIAIGMVASTSRGYRELEELLVPDALPHETRKELLTTVHRAGDAQTPSNVDLVLYEPGLPRPRDAFQYNRAEPLAVVREILDANEELGLALARRYPVFRKPVVNKIVQAVARENALFAIATALPNVVPNLFELPWAFGEFASDTAFLTVNQIRMALMIAAASGADVGFSDQKLEILSIAGGAFGWRAIARELAGKIPLGGGLIPKGAIAYAGTFLVGKGLERYHQNDIPLTQHEQDEIYQQAYEQGRAVAESLPKPR